MGKLHSKLEKHIDDLPPDERYFGLVNFGQTCYMNSVLQALYFCMPFREAVLTEVAAKNEDTLMRALADLFEQISTNKKKHGIIHPRKFFTRLRRDNDIFSKYMQQDAQEFMIFLLNKLSDLIKEAQKQSGMGSRQTSAGSQASSTPSTTGTAMSGSDGGDSSDTSTLPSTWIEELFEGKLTNETRCLLCEAVKKTDEPFLNLSVEVDQNSSLSSCLKSFSASEHMKGDSKYFCESCCSYQEAELRMRIKTLPRILTIQLKRFMYSERLDRFTKLSYRVAYPQELRLFNTTDDAKDCDKLYELAAVVVHVGNRMSSGHYISVVKSANHWLLYDDDSVQVVPESYLEELFGMTETQQQASKYSDTAYILFYVANHSPEV